MTRAPSRCLRISMQNMGGSAGVLVILPRQLRPSLIGVGAQKQPVIAPAGTNQQRQCVPFGLIDLIHPAARQFFIQFLAMKDR